MPMPLSFLFNWKKRDTPDNLDAIFTGLAVACGVFVVLLDPEKKAWAAAPGAAFSLGSAIAKRISKSWDRREKEEKEAASEKEKELREAAAASLAKRVVLIALTSLRQEFFSIKQPIDGRAHRVTLFVCADCTVGTAAAKRLEVFARVGEYANSTTTWAVDENTATGCRGLAAEVWHSALTDFKEAECDWPTDGNMQEKQRYAASLGITVDEAEAMNIKSRSLGGAPVLVGGRRWGVLLLDSTKVGAVKKEQKGALDRHARAIGQMLLEIES